MSTSTTSFETWSPAGAGCSSTGLTIASKPPKSSRSESRSVLVHDRFVFLQMRKTGSTFLSTVLQEELPSGTLSPGSEHADWSKIPSGADDRPVLVYVRNPWDWDVSWYHFSLMQGGTGNGYWRVLSERGELGFAETMRKALRASVAIMGADLFSTLFRNLIGDGLNSERLTVGRFES